MQPRRQVLALFMGLLGALVSLWRPGESLAMCVPRSLRDPDACVAFTDEQAYAPKRCKALQAYADANTHLLAFCALGGSHEHCRH